MANEPTIANRDHLHRVFELIVFDWDGTAVRDRTSSALPLCRLLEKLLTDGALCVVITGTNAQNILKQDIGSLSPGAKRNLYLCANRGSEVFGFDEGGVAQALYRRKATDAENRSLDEAAKRLQEFARRNGLETQIISDRLNRRKIDIIPISKWADPKKSQFSALLIDVQDRLKKSAFSGGIAKLMDEALTISRAAGLPDPKITSDIKHIEIGLTDKADSIHWVAGNIVAPRRISHDQVIFFGDEFGTVGGIPGSDSLMRVPELANATFASVGVEPEGTPPWVLHLSGGPDRFLAFLENQITIRKQPHSSRMDTFSQDPAWRLELEGFEPSREREIETLFAIGNGYLGVRGASSFPIPASQEDLFIAGVYDKKALTLPYSETQFLTNRRTDRIDAEIVPFPYPFRIRLFVDKNEISAGHTHMPEHGRILDMKKGIYSESHRFEDDGGGSTHVRIVRWTSFDNPHLLFQEIWLTSENHSGEITLDLTMRAPDRDPEYPHLKLESRETQDGLTEHVVYQTQASAVRASFASRIFVNAKEVQSPTITLQAKPREAVHILKLISVFTSQDVKDPLAESKTLLLSMKTEHLAQYFERHASFWEKFWEGADVEFEGRPEITQAQRFNLYHLRIAANTYAPTSVAAKALTGRAYEGHVFWDSEIFMFPFYLHTEPEIAKSLLMYRYRTLGGARQRAYAIGNKGACYAWESTVTGGDVTPEYITIKETGAEIPIFTGPQQIHVTADVAFAVFRYWDATLDNKFMLDYGAELLLETARFWASRAIQQGSSYHLLTVVGPDEYHHDVGDNFYTNWMARFNLEKAADVWEWIQKKYPDRYVDLTSRFGVQTEELESWRKISRAIFLPQPTPEGVLEQFDGFFRLKDAIIPPEDRMRAPIRRLFNWREINQLKIIKQADVLMVPFLFPQSMSNKLIRTNFEYYEPRTDHGSSLSLCVHAAIAARSGLSQIAEKFWEESLNLDLTNAMSNTELGIHAAAIGGTWQALVFHMMGIEFGQNGIVINHRPEKQFPFQANGVRLNLFYRGKRYPVRVTKEGSIAA